MRYNGKNVFLLLLLSLLFLGSYQPSSCTANAVEVSDDTLEENPDYVDPEDASDYSDDEDESEDEEETDEEEDEEEEQGETDVESSKKKKKKSKSVLAKALSKTKPKKTIKLIKKHRTTIILVLLVYAFRIELLRFVFKLLAVPVHDPATGKVVGRRVRLNPTSALKLFFFVHFMWKTFRQGEDASPNSLGLPHEQSALFSHFNKPHVYVPQTEQHWTFERLDERYEKDGMALQKAMGESLSTSSNSSSPMSLSSLLRDVMGKDPDTASKHRTGTVIVVDMTKLSTTVAQMDLIRDQVSFLLSQHQANQTRLDENKNETDSSIGAEMEVVILLESPGGGVSDYGLAAAQLMRLRNELGIQLTVCVDKVAASGGYMMASVADKILAAPFAMLGSIGVYGQAINIHDVLDGWGVKDLIFRAGRNKAPLGLIGEVTQAGRDNIQKMIDTTHVAFKQHVSTARPELESDIDDIATGDVWLGYNALDRGLVDRLVTSDEYLGERMKEGARVLKLIKYRKPSFGFGPRPSPYSLIRGLAQSVVAQVKGALIESVNDATAEQHQTTLNARSFEARTVQTKSPIL